MVGFGAVFGALDCMDWGYISKQSIILIRCDIHGVLPPNASWAIGGVRVQVTCLYPQCHKPCQTILYER